MGAASADTIPWRVMRTQHFMIYYAPGADSTAKRASVVAEKWHRILSRKLEFSSSAITMLYLYPDRPSFSEATGVGRADRVVGMAHARAFRVEVDASGAFTDVEHVIPHELVHVFISRILRARFDNVPLWAHEGMAKYLADDWSTNDAELLADAASSGEVLQLKQIPKVFPSDERGRSVAYVQSYSIVKYIADKYGADSLPYLLTQVASGEDFDNAFHSSTGKFSYELEIEWRQFLSEKYGINRLIKAVTSAIPVVMGVLVVLAYRVRTMQKRRKAEEMEAESRNSQLSMDDSPVDD